MVFDLAVAQGWQLLISRWVLREVRENLRGRPEAERAWGSLRGNVSVQADELVFPWPLLFRVAKDKPVLITALQCADVLLTLDRRDFADLLGKRVYQLRVLTPGAFLREERAAGRL
ncbi:hypothetical protein BH20VER1_BH20VER1_31290 [soil metagenome]